MCRFLSYTSPHASSQPASQRELGGAVVGFLLLSLGKGIGDPQKLSLTIAIKRIDFYNLRS